MLHKHLIMLMTLKVAICRAQVQLSSDLSRIATAHVSKAVLHSNHSCMVCADDLLCISLEPFFGGFTLLSPLLVQHCQLYITIFGFPKLRHTPSLNLMYMIPLSLQCCQYQKRMIS
jgi:hypothetical protein